MILQIESLHLYSLMPNPAYRARAKMWPVTVDKLTRGIVAHRKCYRGAAVLAMQRGAIGVAADINDNFSLLLITT